MMEGTRSFQLLIFSGVLFVLVGAWLVFSRNSISTGNEIARIEVTSGSAFLVRNHQRKPISRHQSIIHLDRVETSDTTQLVIQTPLGDHLRLFESAIVIFDQQQDHLLIQLLHGDLIVEEIAENSSAQIISQGEKYSLKNYQLGVHQQKISISQNANEEGKSEKKAADEQEISQESLRSFIQKNRVQFFKCYSSLIQREPASKGEVQLAMTILKNGKITQPSVLQNFTEDPEFKNCLLQVLSRTEIPAFRGDSLTTIVPLVFE